MTTVKSVQHVIKHNCTHLKLYFRVRITVGMIQNGNIEFKPPETGPATEPGTRPLNRSSILTLNLENISSVILIEI